LPLEDKVVQQAVAAVLEAIYEEDFVGFSYGFRPGRGQHDALDALHVGILRKRVNWVLDADIRGFYDALSHTWIIRLLEHRIADKRILRLIAKWLKVVIIEDGRVTRSQVGAPQGAVISPILANVYLHYVNDLWVQRWRHTKANGDVIVVRYADDQIVGFEHEHEAKAFLHDLHERMRAFELALHPDKTRLILRSLGQSPELVVVLQPGEEVLAQVAQATQPESVSLLGALVRLVDRFFPPIKVLHPLPLHRFDARTRGRSPVR